MTNREPHIGTDNALYVPRGTTADVNYALDIDPKRAGWTHSSLRIVELGPGGTHMFTTGDSEWIVLPLNGGCTVDIENEKYQLLGRDNVFSGVTDFAYVPRDARAQIASGAGGRFALAGAKCERRLPARYGPAPEVLVEQRGSGTGLHQVRALAAADAFACDRLTVVEVITPGGNRSAAFPSDPRHDHEPHQHEPQEHAGTRPGEESEPEEIHYFEIDGPNGFGGQLVFPSREGGSDVLTEVRSGDAVLVPDARHGVLVAQPGHAMYCLNVMAGPGENRQWRIRFHPDHVPSTEGYR
ncbi:5-deoxy-glucuronate isomerase [Streptomyces sp. NPDC098781]|uniref:5-deoxy-glucuronate isomerase n=1 Tax=Streptomyces sp. NPDC098781 TaxID=3366097 RepID=UPI00380F2432